MDGHGAQGVAAGLLCRAVYCRTRMADVLQSVADVVNRLHEFEDVQPWRRLDPDTRQQWARCWRQVHQSAGCITAACQPAAGCEAGADLWGPVPDLATVTSWLHTLERGVALHRDLDLCRALSDCSEGDRDALDAEYEALEDLAERLVHALAAEECLVASIKTQVCETS